MAIKGADLLMVLAGAVLTYTGVTSPTGNPKSLLSTLLAGKTPAAPAAAVSAPAATGTAAPAGTGTYQAYAQQLLALHGWSAQWADFNSLEMAEAGYDPTSRNPTSGAYGIAQALGHGSSATAGTDANEYGGYVSNSVAKQANSGDGYAQLQWMMAYIGSRWGSPANAWSGYHSRGSWY